jgi:hypothetical protein
MSESGANGEDLKLLQGRYKMTQWLQAQMTESFHHQKADQVGHFLETQSPAHTKKNIIITFILLKKKWKADKKCQGNDYLRYYNG